MKLQIKGAIVSNSDKWVYDMLDMEATSAKDIIENLPDSDEAIELIINSGGGDLNAGSEIYTALKAHQGEINVKIVALAASAASLIAMAGDTVEMSPMARMMIHNPTCVTAGDNRALRHTATILDKASEISADAYALKSGKTRDEILSLMNDETWFTPDEAIENGFADSKMFEDATPKLVANTETMLSNEAISKVTAMMNKTPEIKIDVEQIADKVIEKIEEKQESMNIQAHHQDSKDTPRFFF